MTSAPASPSSVLAEAVARQSSILRARLPHAVSGEETAVHRARVASRRLREALAVIEAAHETKGAGRLRREVRRVTRALGPVREIDVSIVELTRAAAVHQWSHARVSVLGRFLATERAARLARMTKPLTRVDLDRVRQRAGRLSGHLVTDAMDTPLLRALRSRVSKRAETALEAIAACGTMYAPERLHHLRIALKKLRYALEFDALARPAGHANAIRALRKSQRQLGHLHDLQVLVSCLGDAGSRRSALAGHAQAAVAQLDRDCREVHAKILKSLTRLTERVSVIRKDAAATRRQLKMTSVTHTSSLDAGKAEAG